MQIFVRAPSITRPERATSSKTEGGGKSGVMSLLSPAMKAMARNRSEQLLNIARKGSAMDRNKNERVRSNIHIGRAVEVFRPVTQEDISMALLVISKDGKKITAPDLKVFYEKYFPANLMPAKLSKILLGANPKDDTITKEQLQSMLVTRQSVDHFEEAFALMGHEQHGDVLTEMTLKRLICRLDDKYGMMRRGDLAALRERFDRDKDGSIGRNDFKKMNMKPL
ncbi:hypothetical protein BC830DRAFT_1079812 [Chytriomyces sp. MP71]|nr:hypothetical protein BC830DRAFT_1079812 [Chytriomyces sp. MP71]